MDPNVTSWLTRSQYSRKRDDLAREYVAYRPPVEHVWPRLARATRRHLASLLLALGERLSDTPRGTEIAPEADPVGRLP